MAPLLLALIFMIIQGSLAYFARNTAASAAREGVAVLRMSGTSADPDSFVGPAEDLSEAFAERVGRLDTPEARGVIDEDDGTVIMIVTGFVDLPLGGRVRIQQSAQGVIEQFSGDTE